MKKWMLMLMVLSLAAGGFTGCEDDDAGEAVEEAGQAMQ